MKWFSTLRWVPMGFFLRFIQMGMVQQKTKSLCSVLPRGFSQQQLIKIYVVVDLYFCFLEKKNPLRHANAICIVELLASNSINGQSIQKWIYAKIIAIQQHYLFFIIFLKSKFIMYFPLFTLYRNNYYFY